MRLTPKELFWLFQTIQSAESCHGLTSEETRLFKKKVFRATAKACPAWSELKERAKLL